MVFKERCLQLIYIQELSLSTRLSLYKSELDGYPVPSSQTLSGSAVQRVAFACSNLQTIETKWTDKRGDTNGGGGGCDSAVRHPPTIPPPPPPPPPRDMAPARLTKATHKLNLSLALHTACGREVGRRRLAAAAHLPTSFPPYSACFMGHEQLLEHFQR